MVTVRVRAGVRVRVEHARLKAADAIWAEGAEVDRGRLGAVHAAEVDLESGLGSGRRSGRGRGRNLGSGLGLGVRVRIRVGPVVLPRGGC